MRPNAWPGKCVPGTEGVVDNIGKGSKRLISQAAVCPKTIAAFLHRERRMKFETEGTNHRREGNPGREHAGYAYIYPLDGGARQEYVLEMTPENIANFIGAHQYDAEKIILTEMLDNLILDTAGGSL